MSAGQAVLITTTPDTGHAHRAMCSELQENILSCFHRSDLHTSKTKNLHTDVTVTEKQVQTCLNIAETPNLRSH